jgi:hypothetical protein
LPTATFVDIFIWQSQLYIIVLVSLLQEYYHLPSITIYT